MFDFWLKRGVDGFRINAVSYLYEDEDLRDEPVAGNGTYTSGLPENTALLYKFRMFIDDWVDTNNASSKCVHKDYKLQGSLFFDDYVTTM